MMMRRWWMPTDAQLKRRYPLLIGSFPLVSESIERETFVRYLESLGCEAIMMPSSHPEWRVERVVGRVFFSRIGRPKKR